MSFQPAHPRHTWQLFLPVTVHWKFCFPYCIVTSFFQNFISVKGILVFWVMALVCALLLKIRLVVMYSLTHLSMKITWLLLWLLPEKIQSLRTSSSGSLYLLYIFWTKLPLSSTHNFFVKLYLNFIGIKTLNLCIHC